MKKVSILVLCLLAAACASKGNFGDISGNVTSGSGEPVRDGSGAPVRYDGRGVTQGGGAGSE